MTARRLALAVAGAFAVLLAVAGQAALGLILGFVVYLTVTSMLSERRPPTPRRRFGRLR